MRPQQLVSTLAVAFLASLLTSGVSAAPFYYYFADDPAATTAPAQSAAQQAQDVASQVQQAAGKAEEKVSGVAQQMQDRIGSTTGAGEAPIRERISGHMSDLYTHSSSAMKGLVDTVQPDIKNIGKDLTEVYQQTREQMGKRIEPLAQTVRPYIDHAQKAVAPYVSKAREEIPKAMSNLGSAVMSKINGNQQQSGDSQASDLVQHATNSIQKEANKVSQEAAESGATQ